MTAVIHFEDVSKAYRLGESRRSLRETVSRLGRSLVSRHSAPEESILWALHGVSFDVARGESLGIIGPNGAGKTTILKLLSKITQPTSGRLVVDGRVSALIELGAGFHPDLTGRENIRLNAAILGLSQKDIAHRFDRIVAFSGLERFLDTPVKRYSSGMYVRLGFSVAAHVEPDVLLVDEVLAVGDAQFRLRCAERMRSLRERGTTMVFISHNMHMVRTMCDRALLLAEGQVHAQGEPPVVIAAYESSLLNAGSSSGVRAAKAGENSGSGGELSLMGVEVLPVHTGRDDGLFSDLPAMVKIHYRASSPQRVGQIYVKMVREDGLLCTSVESGTFAPENLDLRTISGNGVIILTYEPLQLMTGTYTAVVGITDVLDSQIIASGRSGPFRVFSGGFGLSQGVYVPRVVFSKRSN
jgi:lipopolysaccharide transport system ATP-binding protein